MEVLDTKQVAMVPGWIRVRQGLDVLQSILDRTIVCP